MPQVARMTALTGTDTRRIAGARLWLPRQHGAWAMLAVPLLLGVAASRADAWQLVLAAAALTGYLASVSVQTWRRSRRSRSYLPPAVVYSVAFVPLAGGLVIGHPVLLATVVVLLPAAALATMSARPGARRDLSDSIAQVVQALALVPASAVVADAFDERAVAIATGVAAFYLVGTVLVVRSVIRERGHRAFAAASTGFHVAGVIAAVVLLSPVWAVLAALMAARAALLPLVQRRLAGTRHPLRPVHVGLLELAVAVVLVATAFAIAF